MIRLDRYLSEMGEGTRSEVKEMLRKGASVWTALLRRTRAER